MYATTAGIDAITCYEISRGYNECGGYSGHSKENIDKSPGLQLREGKKNYIWPDKSF